MNVRQLTIFILWIAVGIMEISSASPAIVVYYASTATNTSAVTRVVEFSRQFWSLGNDIEAYDTSILGSTLIGDKNGIVVNTINHFQALNYTEVDVDVGPPFDFQMLPFIAFPHNENIPVVSYLAKTTTDPLLSAPGFYRVTYSLYSNTKSLLALCTHFNWKRIGVVHVDDTSGLDFLHHLLQQTIGLGNDYFDPAVIIPLNPKPTAAELTNAGKRLSTAGIKIVIMHINPAQLPGLYNALQTVGMITEGYAYMTTSSTVSQEYQAILQKMGAITVEPDLSHISKFPVFGANSEFVASLNEFEAFLFDSIWLATKLRSNATLMHKNISYPASDFPQFAGVTGNIKFDESNNRRGLNFRYRNYGDSPGGNVCGGWNETANAVEWRCITEYSFRDSDAVSRFYSNNNEYFHDTFFAGGTKIIPSDTNRPKHIRVALSHYGYPFYADGQVTQTNPQGFGGFHYDVLMAVQTEIIGTQLKSFSLKISQNESIATWLNVKENLGSTGNYDIIAAAWIMQPARAREQVFFEPLLEKGDVIVLKRNAKGSKNMFFFFDPFSLTTWMMIIVFLIVGTFILFVVENVECKKRNQYENITVPTVNDGHVDNKATQRIKKVVEHDFITTGLMFWYHHMGDVKPVSLSARVIILAMFFGIFVMHELYLASILDFLVTSKTSIEPFAHMSYDEFMSDNNNVFACPKGWNQCEIEYPMKKIALDANSDADFAKLTRKLADGAITGLVIGYEYGLSMIEKSCKDDHGGGLEIGFMPVGKNGWADDNNAGIVRRTKSGWVMRKDFLMQQEVDAAILSLRERGELQRIFNKHFQPCDPPNIDDFTLKITFDDVLGLFAMVSGIMLATLIFAFRPAALDKWFFSLRVLKIIRRYSP